MALEFKGFPKIPRFFREVIITEKIDGTNAAIVVDEDGTVGAQSRSRLITPDNDNHGFASWVREKADDLRQLGPGHHFGEWWGRGIQRGYGLEEKRFSLFHLHKVQHKPDCVGVVPAIYRGGDPYGPPWTVHCVRDALDQLKENGSYAAPGFMQPEGIVVFHTASRESYKVLIENDAKSKGDILVRTLRITPPPPRIGDRREDPFITRGGHMYMQTMVLGERDPRFGDANEFGEAFMPTTANPNGEWRLIRNLP